MSEKQPDCVRERWNFEADIDTDRILVCRNHHDKGASCEMVEMHPVDVVIAINEMRACIARQHALLEEMAGALQGVITWDRARNNRIPYRVRDPIHAVLAKWEASK